MFGFFMEIANSTIALALITGRPKDI